MSKSKHVAKVCWAIFAVTLIITVLFMNGESLGIAIAAQDMPYVNKLFNTEKVHTINIVVDDEDWQQMLNNATKEEYISCSIVIDGEVYKNVAIRTKGNSSLAQVASSDSDRYSFKVEFDHYDKTSTYYGLDKLSLNNIVQNNTYLKDYISYDMLRIAGADSPLASFAWLTVNNEDWGLYLAVEGIEEGFARRNYGSDYGNIYKPDSIDLNARGWDNQMGNRPGNQNGQMPQRPGRDGDMPQMPGGFNGELPQIPEVQGGMIPQRPGNNWGAPQIPDIPDGWNFQGQGSQNGEFPQIPGSQGEFPQIPGNQGEFPGFPENPDAMTGPSPNFSQNTEDSDTKEGSEGNNTQNRQNNGRLPGNNGAWNIGRGMGPGMGGMGSNDVRLIYTDDNHSSYSNIFDNAVFDVSNSDKDRLIASLKQLNEQSNIEEVVDVDKVISYFAAHNFVLNGDSYTGSIVHNYYLREYNGKLSMIPWDYNLAFGGMIGGASDATSLVNYPIDSPASGDMNNLPMLSWIFSSSEYTQKYHETFDKFISSYYESGYFEEMIDKTIEMIKPYVEKDPTAFCTYEEFLEASEQLKKFCLLRAESVRKQLDGVIPSTREGQAKDSSNFVDASSVNVSSMGSNRFGMGRKRMTNLTQN